MAARPARAQHGGMQKLTSVLACSDDPEHAWNVVAKAAAIALNFNARVELYEGKDIVGHAAKTRPDLIVKNATGAGDFKLARACAAPLMLVHERPWSEPLRFAAALDVSDDEHAHQARCILHTAGFLATGAQAELEILYSERETDDERLRMARVVKLAQLVREFHVGCEHIRRVEGAPEKTLPALAAERRHDVLIIGADTRRTGWSRFLPGTAQRAIDAFAGDVVLVRTPARHDELAAARSAEQCVYQCQELT